MIKIYLRSKKISYPKKIVVLKKDLRFEKNLRSYKKSPKKNADSYLKKIPNSKKKSQI